jgi:hypothetical protein
LRFCCSALSNGLVEISLWVKNYESDFFVAVL